MLTGVALAGSTVTEAYQQLLSSTVVIQMIPFLYLFAGLFRLEGARGFSRAMGGLGLLATVLAIVIAFFPPHQVGNVPLFEIKMAAGVLLTLGVGLAFYWKARRPRPAAIQGSSEAA